MSGGRGVCGTVKNWALRTQSGDGFHSKTHNLVVFVSFSLLAVVLFCFGFSFQNIFFALMGFTIDP